MNGHYSPGDVVLGNWTLVRLIGEGSFGKVFEAEREDFGTTYRAAIKIVTIPQSDSEVKRAYAEGMDGESVTAYFRGFVEEIIQEFVLMSELKGTSNVVSYEDHTVIPHQDRVGWDIIIRMELLTPLLDFMQEHRFTRGDVIGLGIDICKALELCQRYNIVHRDVKPENMFVSRLGDYKLGDFGIARTVEKTTGGLSKKGTYTYMAPEVYKGEAYGSGVDLYSLGIVLYTLLNENRAPFLPAYPAPITHSDRENAMAKRMSGTPLPPPKNADGRLAEIVLKACAYQPRERYANPTQMRQELEAVLGGGEAPVYSAGSGSPARPERQIPAGQPEQVNPAEATDWLFGQRGKASQGTQQEEKTEYLPPQRGQPAPVAEPAEPPVSQHKEEAGKKDKASLRREKKQSAGQETGTLDNAVSWPLVLAVIAAEMVAYIFFCIAFRRLQLGYMNYNQYVVYSVVGDGIPAGLLLYLCVCRSRKTALWALPAVTVGQILGFFVGSARSMGIGLAPYSIISTLLPYGVCLAAAVLIGNKIQSNQAKVCAMAVLYTVVYVSCVLTQSPWL